MAIDKDTYHRIYSTAYQEGRKAGLEEAARVADGYCTNRTDDVAAAIRKLKDRKEG